MKPDCSDIRFAQESNGVFVELPYWIESGCNTTNTSIWVKVKSIPADSLTEIYMVYGNQSVESKSNGDGTFEFFDDFDGISLNTSKWDKYNAPSTYSVSNSQLKMWGEWGSCCDGGCVYKHLNTKKSFILPFAVESRFMVKW